MSVRGELIKTICMDRMSDDMEEVLEKILSADKQWVEGQHKRDQKGRFAGNGGSGSHAESRPREGKTKPESAKGRYFAGKPKDVTNEYRMTAKPGKGKKTYEEGYSESGKDEEPIADWLINTFGGNVHFLNRLSRWPEKSPDFMWRGKLWDLKTPDESSENAIKKCLQSGKRQIKPEPGGIIMDLDRCKAKLKDVENYIVQEAERNAKFDFDVIILHSGKNYKVLRFDQKKEKRQK